MARQFEIDLLASDLTARSSIQAQNVRASQSAKRQPILSTMHTRPILPSTLAQSGFATVPDLLTPQRVAELQAQAALLSPTAARNALDLPWCQALAVELAALPPVREALQTAIGTDVAAVQCTLFDKSAERNWLVAWHQDLSLPLAERHDTAGWSGWSSKHGVVFAQPPVALLARVLALRLHLDDCGPDDGALRVRPGSHLSALRMHLPDDTAPANLSESGDVAESAQVCELSKTGELNASQNLAATGTAKIKADPRGEPNLGAQMHAAPADLARLAASEDRSAWTSTPPNLAESVPNPPEQLCPVPAGGALLMRPLLQHASSKSSSGKPRRVLHFVFAPRALPQGLRWRWAV